MNSTSSDPYRHGLRYWLAVVIQLMLGAAIIGVAVWGAKWMLDTPAKARKKRDKPEVHARLVEVVTVRPQSYTLRLDAMGQVVASDRLVIQPRVGGRLESVDDRITIGSMVQSGQVLATIDSSDYKLARDLAAAAVAQAEARIISARAQVAVAEKQLKLEKANQAVARREFELLGVKASEAQRELILRKPHLEEAMAQVSAARAGITAAESDLAQAQVRLADAELDLSRTVIRAPMDGIVVSLEMEAGQNVTTGSRLLTLLGSRRGYVMTKVRLGDLQWLNLTGQGASARVADPGFSSGHWRQGKVVDLSPEVDTGGQMASLVIEVADPFLPVVDGRTVARLLVGRYVNVQIAGRTLQGVYVLDPSWLRDGSTVWVMDADGKLQVTEVHVLWRDSDTILIDKGLSPGDRVVKTDLLDAVSGMALRTVAGSATQPTSQPQRKGARR